MRVISGYLGGRTLVAPRGSDTRPTGDRVRESLFAILGDLVLDANVLDLFAGSGSLGIEAISRGAKSCIFVDKDRVPVEVIRKNVSTLELEGVTSVISMDAIKALTLLSGKEEFDLVFADPPYKAELHDKVIETIVDLNLLKKSGILVLEYSAHNRPSESVGGLLRVREAKYGETLVGFYSYRVCS